MKLRSPAANASYMPRARWIRSVDMSPSGSGSRAETDLRLDVIGQCRRYVRSIREHRFDSELREDRNGQALTGVVAGTGRQHRADREALRQGPVDGVLLDEEVRPRVALSGEARRQ